MAPSSVVRPACGCSPRRPHHSAVLCQTSLGVCHTRGLDHRMTLCWMNSLEPITLAQMIEQIAMSDAFLQQGADRVDLGSKP